MARRADKNGKTQVPSSRRRDSRECIVAGVIPPSILRGVVGGDGGIANTGTVEPSPLPPSRG
jgi:hypothetical protein